MDADAAFDWVMEHNLNEIVRFRNFLVANLDKHAVDLADDVFAHSTLESYREYLAANTFLMAYSFLEEYLWLLWKSKAKGISRASGFSIDRYEPILRGVGFDTGLASWCFMKQARDIRHCMLHANGRLAFMEKPPRHAIELIVAEYPEGLAVTHDRLRVSDEFTRRFVDEIRTFRAGVKEAMDAQAERS
jgi:hypothetical protein